MEEEAEVLGPGCSHARLTPLPLLFRVPECGVVDGAEAARAVRPFCMRLTLKHVVAAVRAAVAVRRVNGAVEVGLRAEHDVGPRVHHHAGMFRVERVRRCDRLHQPASG